jgi:hypothetical protein
MPQPTEVRAFKWKGPGPIGRDFYGNCFALWQLLVNVKGFQLESMIPVERFNDQLDTIASLCFDYVWGTFLPPGDHFYLAVRPRGHILSQCCKYHDCAQRDCD